MRSPGSIIEAKVKPHLYKEDGVWVCIGMVVKRSFFMPARVAIYRGQTVKQAYNGWRQA